MYLREIPIDALYERYRLLVKFLPWKVRWLAMVFAPVGTTSLLFWANLLGVFGAFAVTIGTRGLETNADSAKIICLLLIGFATESISWWIKERQEMELVFIVRQITYRRFHDIFANSSHQDMFNRARKQLLTYPGQISQFAFIVDAVTSTVKTLVFLVLSFMFYEISGLIAATLIAGLVAASVRLIHLVGRVWGQYIKLEGERRCWIQRISDALPRGAMVPSWNRAVEAITEIRNAEEKLLRKRTLLQVINGFLDKGALTFSLALAAILGAWLWPQETFGIGIILAARYLYSAVQSVVTDYRIIRLAVPMMRDLDGLEQTLQSNAEEPKAIDAPTSAQEVLLGSSDRVEAIRTHVSRTTTAFVPRNPELPQQVLSIWKEVASAESIAQFYNLAQKLDLSEEQLERMWQDSTTLSSGERHRIALALVLVDKPEWLILDDTFAALDPETREEVAKLIVE